MIDLSQISDEELNKEYWRRVNARRQSKSSGRPKVLRPCQKCGVKFGFNELRAHQPKCTGAVLTHRAAGKAPMTIRQARGRLMASLGPHAWIERATNNGRRFYTAGIGASILVDKSHESTSPEKTLNLALSIDREVNKNESIQ